MSEETKEKTAAAENETTQADQKNEAQPIVLEPEDLTAEGKTKAEESLKRSIEDYPYTVASQETVKGSRQVLKVEMPRDAFVREQELLLKDVSKEVSLPGFRKGKAPLKLLQIQLGESAKRDTVGSLATNALRQENAKQTFDMVSKPQVTEFDVEGDPVKFTVEIEVKPAVELKQYKGFEVEVEDRPVDDSAVLQRLDQLRRQNAVMASADKDHELSEEDVVTLDMEVTDEGGEVLPHLSKQDEVFHGLHRLPHPVVDAITGKKVGDEVTVMVPNKMQNRRGEEIIHNDRYKITIKDIKVSKLPDLDDEFAKDLGEFENLEDLKKKTREDLEREEETRQRGDALGKIYHKIVEANPVDPPQSLIDQQAYNLIMEDSYQLQRMGLRLEQVVQDTDQYLNDQRSSADESVKLQLVLEKLADEEKLEVTDEDVEKEIERIAEESGRKPLAVRARLEASKQLDEFRQNLRRKKISDFVLENNTVKKVEPKPEEEAKPEAAEAEKEEKPKGKKEKA